MLYVTAYSNEATYKARQRHPVLKHVACRSCCRAHGAYTGPVLGGYAATPDQTWPPRSQKAAGVARAVGRAGAAAGVSGMAWRAAVFFRVVK